MATYCRLCRRENHLLALEAKQCHVRTHELAAKLDIAMGRAMEMEQGRTLMSERLTQVRPGLRTLGCRMVRAEVP